GEENQNGENDKRSWNCGVEGATDDPAVVQGRGRQQRNLLGTLILSQGVPMLLGGDEIGRTQHGNNNGYCQDNEISWYNWASADPRLLQFTRRLIAFRQEHPVFHRRRFFQGRAIHGAQVEDVEWFTFEGGEMAEENWGEGYAKSLGVFLNGEAIPTPDENGLRVTDDSFYLMFNAHYEPLSFHLPDKRWSRRWELLLDTDKGWLASPSLLEAGDSLEVQDHSVLLLRKAD
ncbi:MAG: glycogen debranching enzyme, partial [Spirochaetia bacterium]